MGNASRSQDLWLSFLSVLVPTLSTCPRISAGALSSSSSVLPANRSAPFERSSTECPIRKPSTSKSMQSVDVVLVEKVLILMCSARNVSGKVFEIHSLFRRSELTDHPAF